MPELFGPIKKIRVAEELASQIKKSILQEKISPGDKLPSERELAEKCSISRAAVREAFRILEKEGLLLIKRGVDGGAFITEVHSKTVEDLFNVFFRYGDVSIDNISEARVVIEPQIAKLASIKRTKENLKEMEEAFNHCQVLIENGKPDATSQMQFHYALAMSSKNPVLIVMLNSLLNFFQKKLFLLNPNSTLQSCIKDQEFHLKLLNAIKSKNEEIASLVMKEHMETFAKINQEKQYN